MNRRHIVFLLPGSGRRPIGGYKVIYEYANQLVDREFTVTLVHSALQAQDTNGMRRLRKRIRHWRQKKTYLPTQWFTLDPNIRCSWVYSVQKDSIPDADIIVATTWQNAEWVASYPESKGKKFYMIQNYGSMPNVVAERERLSWKLPLHKIVISRWLAEIAENMEEPCSYVQNGLDFKAFGVDCAITERAPESVLMLSHKSHAKGSSTGIAALSILKKELPQLQATLYGVGKRPKSLPDWAVYERSPSQRRLRELYNKASIFIAPSLVEGWGLPPSEAMMCGCAVVATDIGGHQEFAINNETALLCAPNDPVAIANKVAQLINDPRLRSRISEGGARSIQKFTWERATRNFIQALDAIDA